MRTNKIILALLGISVIFTSAVSGNIQRGSNMKQMMQSKATLNQISMGEFNVFDDVSASASGSGTDSSASTSVVASVGIDNVTIASINATSPTAVVIPVTVTPIDLPPGIIVVVAN